MTRRIDGAHALSRMFRGLTEQTFAAELGIADPPLVDYVADLLTRFVPAESVWRIRDRQGGRLSAVAAMIAEAEAAEDEARRSACHRHVGDFTLFWTGVYPEAVTHMNAAGSPDRFIDYCRQGKRSYFLAAAIDGEDASILLRLSREFELCAFGLSKVRKEWEKRDVAGPPPGAILR